jgi:signal transduction histidine kinase
MAEAKQIELRFEVRCYGQRIGQSGPLGRVLLNLVTNAIKFTPEGGTVEVLADSISRDMVEISVRDTGRGLPREHQERMFQPFRKSRGRQGFFFAASGLGLTIVRRLLEKMDAELKIESEVGQGTRFAFVLSLPTPQ